jgi:antitoxin (DNA-binding transcriptional repressor) of toxin-antitoxin stability system
MTDKVTDGDLRSNGGEILSRVASGETLILTRDGEPVAELRPLPRRSLPAGLLLERWHALPDAEAAGLRADIDDLLDPGL